MTKTTTARAIALLAGGATLGFATPSRAASYDCTTLTNTVYIAGSTASKPLEAHIWNRAVMIACNVA